MASQYFTERDWKLFRDKLPVWQESYIEKCNKEYMSLLASDEAPSEKFGMLKNRIREDEDKFLLPLRMSRTNFIANLLALLHNYVIEMTDLADFSDELKHTVETAYNL